MNLTSVSKREPFLAWPGTKAFLKIAMVYATTQFIYSIFYNGSGALKEFTPWRFRLYFPFELEIPYWQSWGIIYASIVLLLALAPFVFRTWQEIVPFCITILFEVVIAATCFILFPLETGFTSVKTGFSALVFDYAHRMNLDGNYLPSFHVVFAVTASMAYAKRAGSKTRVILTVWSAAICVSTVLYHTHHIIDVVGGVILSVVGMRLVYKWAEEKVVPALYMYESPLSGLSSIASGK